MSLPKIKFSSLKRTNFGFPSEFKTTLEDSTQIVLSYRCGILKLFVNSIMVHEMSKDDLDVGGFLEDKELYDILAKNDILDD